MSMVRSHELPVLEGILPGMDVFELFPGNHPGSIDHLVERTGRAVTALGDDDFPEREGLVYHQRRVPPYPSLDRRFDAIVVFEPLFLWHPEVSIGASDGGLVSLSSYREQPPSQAVSFLDEHLAENGGLYVARASEHEVDVVGHILAPTDLRIARRYEAGAVFTRI